MTSRGPSLPPISYLRTSGGQLRDQTVHFFDLLRWISEDEPEEVYVFGTAFVDPKVAEVGEIDTSIVAIRLSRGTLCHIDSSRRTGYGYDERIEVFGSDGSGSAGCRVISVIKSSKTGCMPAGSRTSSKAIFRLWTLSSGQSPKASRLAPHEALIKTPLKISRNLRTSFSTSRKSCFLEIALPPILKTMCSLI